MKKKKRDSRFHEIFKQAPEFRAKSNVLWRRFLGGFTRREAVEALAEYVEKMVRSFVGRRVKKLKERKKKRKRKKEVGKPQRGIKEGPMMIKMTVEEKKKKMEKIRNHFEENIRNRGDVSKFNIFKYYNASDIPTLRDFIHNFIFGTFTTASPECSLIAIIYLVNLGNIERNAGMITHNTVYLLFFLAYTFAIKMFEDFAFEKGRTHPYNVVGPKVFQCLEMAFALRSNYIFCVSKKSLHLVKHRIYQLMLKARRNGLLHSVLTVQNSEEKYSRTQHPDKDDEDDDDDRNVNSK